MKTHCKYGHERIAENLTKGGNCRICKNEQYVKWYNDNIKSKIVTVKTHCKRGHEKTPENTAPDGKCKTCARERAIKWYNDNIKSNLIIIKTHCKRGHEKTPENTTPDGRCKPCRQNAAKQWLDSNSKKKRQSDRNRYLNNKEKIDKQKLEWSARNREKVRAGHKVWRDGNKDRTRMHSQKYYEEKKEAILKQNGKWRIANTAKMRAYTRKYQLAKRNRVPKWLTNDQLLQIESIYSSAIEKSKNTGIKHHVDHIVPLQGRNVSGLHVPWNLQVITATENHRKNNRWEV